MTIQDAIRQRHSVRSYSDRPVEKEKLKALQALVDEYNQQSGLHIHRVRKYEYEKGYCNINEPASRLKQRHAR